MASCFASSDGFCLVMWRLSKVGLNREDVLHACFLHILLPRHQYCTGFFAPFVFTVICLDYLRCLVWLWQRAQHSALRPWAYGFARGRRREVFDTQAHPDDRAILCYTLPWMHGWPALAQWKFAADHAGWKATYLGIALDMHFKTGPEISARLAKAWWEWCQHVLSCVAWIRLWLSSSLGEAQ
mmetsp:Transcript_95713/g.200072  ORF Transcript_95713/g.200072 Transcript_95713/m.200072 type:complete len:183 (-) Transcript_95713:141-689(-)